ncbi:dynamin family protein [Actinoplanes regularis]|uniref:Dynamin family protein n=1 Tax=Actinoplanes regularis TaxID=52697 RepID=A0A239BU61_9ACTN|nr:dynamin family protein [Actinoplanes regularis]GIE88292.1 dynamin [Actinoplanes regularis]SNS11199.1 Dynamin family protein [Actinoplanes regularis]
MTTAPADAAQAAATPPGSLLALGIRACTAYGREDLARRLAAAQRALNDPSIHVVIAGEFKQGKSSLVNALVGATVCPVDDDVATATPTYVRHGEKHRAALILDGDPPRREDVPVDQVRRYVTERRGAPAGAGPGPEIPVGVEVRLPRKILERGMVLVDTPGVGGLGSTHAAASLAAISMADAVIFVTSAAQELTASEVQFLRKARAACDTVICLISKTDFYPAWRRIRELNEAHLRRAELALPVLTASSALRMHAVKAGDREINAESGFAEVVEFVSGRVGGGVEQRLAEHVRDEVLAVCDQLTATFAAERAALLDPAAARRIVAELERTRQRVESLKTSMARWQQTLNDGIADLTSDIDHDLRSRMREVTREADDSIDESDPADTWAEMQTWLRARIAHELVANYELLRVRAGELSENVGEHFRAGSDGVLGQLTVHSPEPVLERTRLEHKIDLEKMKLRKQAMVALKSAYGGTLMFTMLASMAGIVLGPIGLGIGLVMGRKGLREEKQRQEKARQQQARNAMRRYCDEVTFVVGKDSRDTLRRIHRRLRDHYTGLAEELARSNAAALAGAEKAARRGRTERESRVRDLDAELGRLATLQSRARPS